MPSILNTARSGIPVGSGFTPVPAAHLARYAQDGQIFTYVQGLDEVLAHAALTGRSLAEAGATWAIADTAARVFRTLD